MTDNSKEAKSGTRMKKIIRPVLTIGITAICVASSTGFGKKHTECDKDVTFMDLPTYFLSVFILVQLVLFSNHMIGKSIDQSIKSYIMKWYIVWFSLLCISFVVISISGFVLWFQNPTECLHTESGSYLKIISITSIVMAVFVAAFAYFISLGLTRLSKQKQDNSDNNPHSVMKIAAEFAINWTLMIGLMVVITWAVNHQHIENDCPKTDSGVPLDISSWLLGAAVAICCLLVFSVLTSKWSPICKCKYNEMVQREYWSTICIAVYMVVTGLYLIAYCSVGFVIYVSVEPQCQDGEGGAILLSITIPCIVYSPFLVVLGFYVFCTMKERDPYKKLTTSEA